MQGFQQMQFQPQQFPPNMQTQRFTQGFNNPPPFPHMNVPDPRFNNQQASRNASSGFPGGNNNNSNLTEYCWTHGLCRHNGFNCRNPADGHNPYATVNNRMGGSNKNCL